MSYRNMFRESEGARRYFFGVLKKFPVDHTTTVGDQVAKMK